MSKLTSIQITLRVVIFCILVLASLDVRAQQGIADAKSAALIEELEEAMGGREAYDAIRTIRWNFFGFRDLVWDKHTGDLRVDVPRDEATFLLNLNTGVGKVKRGQEIVEHPDSLSKALDQARRMWINDAYWLVMPWKLRDAGVTVSYLSEGETESGEPADVMSLTFNEVGVTPQNKYHIWITKEDKLLKQWAFYPDASDEEPRSIWPWDNYQLVDGTVKLSFDRSDDKGPKAVKVEGVLDAKLFTEF